MINLNLACGTDIREPPWVNLDVVRHWPLAKRPCDVIWDARKDKIPYPEATVDQIYAGYLFLHLAPVHHQRVLEDCWRVLKFGGLLVVGEVDMDLVLRRWLLAPTDRRLAELIWGEQGELGQPIEAQRALAEYDKHCHGYTEGTLRAFLRNGGFVDCERVSVHSKDVWYELTLAARKPKGV